MPETNSFAASRISFVFAASSFLGIIWSAAGTFGSVNRKCTISAASVRYLRRSFMSGISCIRAAFTSALVMFMLLSTQTGSPSSPMAIPEYSGPTCGAGNSSETLMSSAASPVFVMNGRTAS